MDNILCHHQVHVCDNIDNVSCIFEAVGSFGADTKKQRKQWHSRVPYIMYLERFFERATICYASAINACCSHRAQYNSFSSMGVTGIRPELAETTVNIICISLKFLHINPPIYKLVHMKKLCKFACPFMKSGVPLGQSRAA